MPLVINGLGGGHTGRHTDRQTDRHTHTHILTREPKQFQETKCTPRAPGLINKSLKFKKGVGIAIKSTETNSKLAF